MVQVDLSQLLLPGEYIYRDSRYGEFKRLVYPFDSHFWVVDVYSAKARNLILGTIYEVRPDGLYVGEATPLERPMATPPDGYQPSECQLLIPKTFHDGQSFLPAGGDQRIPVKVVATISMVRQGDEDFIVLRSQSSNVFEDVDPNTVFEGEEWWRPGIGMVRGRLTSPPPPSEMELITARPSA